MSAKMMGLFSGFPSRQFPAEIAERLKEELPMRDSLVFVSAWPDEYDRNDCDAAGMHAMFANWEIPFQRFCVIDSRTEPSDAKRLIREATCIFLMGGHATQQMQLICEKGLKDEICSSTAVILGVSAGSSNMARRALDIWESHVPYNGLGLTDMTIKAHVTPENQALVQTLMQISLEHALPIYAMEDESAIFIKEEHISSLGRICLINEGKLTTFTAQ